jgi:hypothetical protein
VSLAQKNQTSRFTTETCIRGADNHVSRSEAIRRLSPSSPGYFPAPAAGSDQAVLWNTSDITTFASTWNSVKSNGWKVSTAALSTFNFTYAAAHAPGAYYTPALTDPLFDDYP